MKATFSGKALNIRRPRWSSNLSDMVEIELDMSGNVDGANIACKPANLKATLQLKQLVADKLTFGSPFTITIDDNVPNVVVEPVPFTIPAGAV